MKMFLTSLAAALVAFQVPVLADIVVPGADGSDCDLVITEDTEIDLSLATTAAWNASYATLAAADPDRVAAEYIGKGVYDPEKWAVVFRYTEVTVAEGATVTFKNHPSRAPVVWLVSGDVEIAGTVSLDGKSYLTAPGQPEPGPGGFRAGVGTYSVSVPFSVARKGGAGLGPGGGNQTSNWRRGFGGSYATVSSLNSEYRPIIYGNPTLLPLIGGSGGASNRNPNIGYARISGGSGGGAILIASQKTITAAGRVLANGGNGKILSTDDGSGGGSGGGIRLVSDSLIGNGELAALGGSGYYSGGQGRVRLERVLNANTLTVEPDASSQVLVEGETALIWLPEEAPKARLVSFGGASAPADPRAGFGGSEGADMIVGDIPTSQAVIETTNLPQDGSQVQVRMTPRHDFDYYVVDAVFDSQISANPLVLRWVADVPIKDGYSALQIRIVAP